MKFSKYLLTAFLLLFVVNISAVERTTLIVDMRDGSHATVALLEQPTITFEGDMMTIVSSKSTMEFKRADVKRYRFHRREITSVEDQPVVLSQATIAENTVYISGVADGTVVTVYTTSGTAVCSGIAAGDECVVSLDSFPCGLYIVTYNDTTIKFFKR